LIKSIWDPSRCFRLFCGRCSCACCAHIARAYGINSQISAAQRKWNTFLYGINSEMSAAQRFHLMLFHLVLFHLVLFISSVSSSQSIAVSSRQSHLVSLMLFHLVSLSSNAISSSQSASARTLNNTYPPAAPTFLWQNSEKSALMPFDQVHLGACRLSRMAACNSTDPFLGKILKSQL